MPFAALKFSRLNGSEESFLSSTFLWFDDIAKIDFMSNFS